MEGDGVGCAWRGQSEGGVQSGICEEKRSHVLGLESWLCGLEYLGVFSFLG